MKEKEIIPEHEYIWINTVRLHRNKCAHSAYSNPTTNDANLVLGAVIHIFEWYDSSFNDSEEMKEDISKAVSPIQHECVPSKPVERRPFHCQLDGEQHPATDAMYECKMCSRLICGTCYEESKQAGLSEYPYCQGQVTQIQ